jgi:hypothetical protein
LLGRNRRVAIVRLITVGFGLYAVVQLMRLGQIAMANENVQAAIVISVIGLVATVLQEAGDRAARLGAPEP